MDLLQKLTQEPLVVLEQDPSSPSKESSSTEITISSLINLNLLHKMRADTDLYLVKNVSSQKYASLLNPVP